MLDVGNLSAAYGGIAALRGVSLRVPAGKMVGLIGPNGAGKTTLLNTISGLLRPQGGHITFAGQELTGWSAHRIARLGLLQVPEGRQVLGTLSVEENLILGRLALGGREADPGDQDLRKVYDLFPILADRRGQQAGSLSGGEQQMLAIGRALMGRPRLLLLDEPSLGLAPRMVQLVFEALRRLNELGLTILLVEQNARRSLDMTHEAYVLEQGRLVQHGPSAALRDDPQIIAHYLGVAGRPPASPT
jgi:branched-chain amino acid transport system ATP-binding protein